ncbi:hypothetical protein B0H17DRAFT_1210928 [Mycena rosella]|uniref:Uncharacterized protein n=1 Tax=Mycena rosella TaxID=1033263 RepID=A0AAD7CVW1_MYCRO|nr:hypothetical protein B0H17DRAFT_1210928 [Mycena rosella]
MAANQIRRIVIHIAGLDAHCSKELDSKLASLSLDPLPTLELERASITRGLTMENLDEYFPQMASRKLLLVVDHQEK